LGFVWNNNGKKLIKKSANVQINDDFHLGYKLEHDLVQASKVHVQAAYTGEHGYFFLEGDFDKKIYTLGTDHWHKEHKHRHSYEVEFDAKKDANEGIKGSPVALKWAGRYNLTDNITWKSKVAIRKDIVVENSWIQKVDERLHIVVSDTENLTNIIHDPKNSRINFGVKLTYTL